MSDIKVLKAKVEDIRNTSPMLIVGPAMKTFLKAWKYKTISISDSKDLKEVIDYYSYVEPSYPLVIYDLAILNKSSLNLLLKFIEEYKYPLILLSSYDNFDSILLSRIKTFLKFSGEPIKSNMLSLGDGIRALNDIDTKDLSNIDLTRKYLEYCPKLYQLNKSIKVHRNKSKIIDILSSI